VRKVALGFALLLPACGGSAEIVVQPSSDSGADATVLFSSDSSVDASLPPDGSAGSSAWTLGPTTAFDDRPCDAGEDVATRECLPVPVASCVDGLHALIYESPVCAAGHCDYRTVNLACNLAFDGGVCVGGEAGSGAPLLPSADAAVSGVFAGCLVPLPASAAPPLELCDPDGGQDAATLCPRPPSVCQKSGTVLFLPNYTNPQCVDGQCTWQLVLTACPPPPHPAN
jgi:hypothetical protein